jgi:hypothetical protein
MENDIRQMMPKRVQSPDGIIYGVRYPCQGMPVACMEIGKCPFDEGDIN